MGEESLICITAWKEQEEQEYWEEMFPENKLLFKLFAYCYC